MRPTLTTSLPQLAMSLTLYCFSSGTLTFEHNMYEYNIYLIIVLVSVFADGV